MLAREGVLQAAPFIVGAPRSGTTLLRLMLDAHPWIAIPAETHFYEAVLGVDPRSDDWVGAVVAAMVGSYAWGDYGMDAGAFERAVRAASPTEPAGVLRTFYHAYAARFGKPGWGDKFPGNTLLIRGIAGLLPEARFIHIIRDGRDVAASLREMWFRPGDSFESCIAYWAKFVRAARREAADGIPYLEVRYEALVQDPQAELRRICAFLEIPYDPSMLTYHQTAPRRLSEMGSWNFFGRFIPREVLLGIHTKTHQPPATDRIGRWKAEMSALDAANCARAAEGLLDELDYR